ncbi:uncharacterized protein TM35_000121290 [Trypanosoma theileri]|uniref:Uncharacterized protein n=1 Tax=Trypanosoma theileri TaxID=67003 RepID=A0A1X0NXC5_9TRYP|nr:uncharacterized protein TM35_000121290 [Trypanosoma theileri]ORC89354.1 hypothetical protein TM35_000121290 [Trypanosoma theileri]
MYSEAYTGELPREERQPMSDHEVLFFGCLAVMISEVRVKGLELQQQLKSCSGAQLLVRAAVTPVGTEAVERIGESIQSNKYALQNAEMADELLIPIMLERAPHVTTNATVTGMSAALSSAASSSSLLKNNNNNNNNVEKKEKENEEEEEEEEEEEKDNLHKSMDEKPSLELALNIDFLRNGVSTTTARRTVMINSLYDVGEQHCGVATARVSAAVLRENKFLESSPSVRVNTSKLSSVSAERNENANWCGVEVQIIVRAIDASAPLRLMLAAEDTARSILRMPKLQPYTMFVFPQQTTIPYGAVQLDALYYFYHNFFEQYFNKTIKTTAHVLQLLQSSGKESTEGGNHTQRNDGNEMNSWSALHSIDLRPVLIGDDALAPLLATLFHCSSLNTMILDENSVSDITCYRLAALFHKHRCLRSISIKGNNIHESGAEQLLRLVRRNKRITKLCANGNLCTSRVLERIQRVVEMNTETHENDPFNVLSKTYAYAVSPISFPSSIVKRALAVWAMLSAASVSVNRPSSAIAASASAVVAAAPAAADNDEGNLSIIPQCALAPLLNEVMRAVACRMSSIIQDPWVRMVFADIESYRRSPMSLQENMKDLDNNKKVQNNDSNKKNSSNNTNNNSNKINNNMLENCNVEDTSEENEMISLVNVEELYNYSFLHIIVVTMRAIAAGGEWTESMAVLRGIGKRQKKIGVMPEDYRDALQAFIQSLTGVCGKDHADAEHSVAFLQCLALGVRTAVSV